MSSAHRVCSRTPGSSFDGRSAPVSGAPTSTVRLSVTGTGARVVTPHGVEPPRKHAAHAGSARTHERQAVGELKSERGVVAHPPFK